MIIIVMMAIPIILVIAQVEMLHFPGMQKVTIDRGLAVLVKKIWKVLILAQLILIIINK